MSLASRFTTQPEVKKGPACWAQHLQHQLEPGDWAALLDALADPTWSTSSIADALRSEGYRVGAHSVGRHRQRKCACPDEVWT